MRVFSSPSHRRRREAAWEFLSGFPPGAPVLVVGASRRAADEWFREWPELPQRGAAFGIFRFSLIELAARLAADELVDTARVWGTDLASRALAARAAYEVRREGGLGYLEPVADFAGFVRQLAGTLDELRGYQPSLEAMQAPGRSGPDLARLARTYEHLLESSALADGARALEAAIEEVPRAAWLEPIQGLLLLDVELERPRAAELILALAARLPRTLAVVPEGDLATLESLGGAAESQPAGEDELGRLQTYLFSEESPPQAPAQGQVTFFSAPGEERECTEIVRQVLQEVRRGRPLDQLAVLLPAAAVYAAPLERALARAQVPVYYSHGTRRPHPGGRAFLALLDCAAERLSALRFAEYLGLAEVPEPAPDGSPPTGRNFTALPEDESLGPLASSPSESTPAPGQTLRSPRAWERLLTEAAVIQGADRWERRLAGLEAEYRLNLENLEPDSARAATLAQDLAHLAQLKAFALPLIQELDSWRRTPQRWSVWLERLQRLAPMALQNPDRVLSTLASLAPLGEVGPVGLEEVRQVLTAPLADLTERPPATRYGRLFVGKPEDARGRSFQVVFVPGLGERVFPPRLLEDPLLLDEIRQQIDPRLPTNSQRAERERLRLRLAVGAAEERLVLSYSRLELAGKGRPKVPSFYALDVLRATRGEIPPTDLLEHEARDAVGARLAWPAPARPELAVDDLEHDLASLSHLLSRSGRGRARYLFDLNRHLHRALRAHWKRWDRRWRDSDGLTQKSPLLEALHPHRRPYSATTLQLLADCPYRFWLQAAYRLEKREPVVPLEEMDPLTRGSLFHRVFADLVWAVKGQRPERADELFPLLEETLARLSDEFREVLYPAVNRVWDEEIRRMRVDLRVWLGHFVEELADWEPIHAELGFGVPTDAEHDPASRPDPVRLPSGYLLRGSIDLLERHRTTGELRVTDFKTGKNHVEDPHARVYGGRLLQPVLYGLVAEELLGTPVGGGRLFFCTSRGKFSQHHVQLDAETRRLGGEVLRSLETLLAFPKLVAAPRAGICQWCDYKAVCGPDEAVRTGRKPGVSELEQLRSLP